MGLFGNKKAKASKPKAEKVKGAPVITADRNLAGIIVKPHITEKAALLSDASVYTFEIHKRATKYDVRDAVKALYNVTPMKVHIVNRQPRHSMSRARGRDVMQHGLRKAYVYLKKGDRIELV